MPGAAERVRSGRSLIARGSLPECTSTVACFRGECSSSWPGLIPLAVRAGWLSASQIAGWWNLWPLVLIGIGVGLVLTRTPFEVIGSVLVAGTFGLMLGAVLAIGIAGFPGRVRQRNRLHRVRRADRFV